MDHERIEVTAKSDTVGASRRSLVGVAVVGAVLIGFFALADFSDVSDSAEDSTVPRPTATLSTVVPPADGPVVVDHGLRTQSFSAADLESFPLTWEPIDYPDGFDAIEAIGEVGGDLVVLAGTRVDAESVMPLEVLGWSPLAGWIPIGTVTERLITVEEALIDDDGYVIVGRTPRTADQLNGQIYVYTSETGVQFSEHRLDEDDQSILSLGRSRGVLWIFGFRVESEWTDLLEALPENIRELVAQGRARLYFQDEEAVAITSLSLELGRYRVEDLLGHAADLSLPGVWEPVAWMIDTGGSLVRAESPFDVGVADTVRRSELGDLTAQIYNPNDDSYTEWLTLDGESWMPVRTWDRAMGDARGGVGDVSVFMSHSPNSPALIAVEDAIPHRLSFETLHHDLVRSDTSYATGVYGVLFSTAAVSAVNQPTGLEIRRDGYDLQVESSGIVTVSQEGVELIRAHVATLARLGSVDIDARTVHLGDFSGNSLTSLEFAELWEVDLYRPTIPSAMGLLASPDLDVWSFTEIAADGVVNAAYVGADRFVVAIEAPPLSRMGESFPSFWVATRPSTTDLGSRWRRTARNRRDLLGG